MVFAFLFFKTQFVSSTQQSEGKERELDSRVPEHLPIKIKIRKDKEKAFKDLQNEHWANDFELEVKNTGSKPIFCLSFLVLIPEVVVALVSLTVVQAAAVELRR